MIRRSRVVIVICQDLEDDGAGASTPTCRRCSSRTRPDPAIAPTAGTGAAIRASLGLGRTRPIVLYTGTFEPYQGLDLLFEAMARRRRARPDARLVMVGGEPAQVDAAREARRGAGSGGRGRSSPASGPAEEIPAYLDAATRARVAAIDAARTRR